jgi:hypothetical protein
MEGVPLPPGLPGIGGSTDPLEAVLGYVFMFVCVCVCVCVSWMFSLITLFICNMSLFK